MGQGNSVRMDGMNAAFKDEILGTVVSAGFVYREETEGIVTFVRFAMLRGAYKTAFFQAQCQATL